MTRSSKRCLIAALLATAFTACGSPEDTHDDHPSQAEAVTLAAHKHEEPGATCFICDPAKREKGRLWCREHGRYEDRCWICHPELEDKSRLYCNEHFLYEDECTLCHPELDTTTGSPAGGETSEGLFCNEHGVPERECGICQPQLAHALEPGGQLLVRFRSEDAATKAGVGVGRPEQGRSAPGIEVLCELRYNANTMARITPVTDGIVRRVFVDVGDRVEAGDVLVELHASEVADARGAFLSARVAHDVNRAAYEREKDLSEQKIAARKDYLAADAAYRTSRVAETTTRQKLINLGLSAHEIAEVARTEDASAILRIRAPFAGTVIERSAVPGAAVAAGDPLFEVADLSTRWLALSVPADRAVDLRVGQPVSARFDDLPGRTVEGRLVWVDTAVDPQTRLLRARALVTDDALRLQAGLFGRARVSLGDDRASLIVPRGAVQRHAAKDFVFVRRAADLYALRRVSLGSVRDGRVEIIDGLRPDDAVVTDAGFTVMSEFLRSRLGAGCVDH